MEVIKSHDISHWQLATTVDVSEGKEVLLIGHSDCNYQMPYYSIFWHNILKKGDIEVIEYFLLNWSLHYKSNTRSYDDLVRKFTTNNYSHVTTFNFKDNEKNNHQIQILSGMLVFENKIIACLAVDINYIFSVKPFDINSRDFRLDNSKLSLYLHSSFYSNPLLKNVIKKFESLYVNKVLFEGVQVIKTHTPLEKVLYGNNFKMPKFKTIEESNRFLNECVTNKYL